MQSMRLRVLHYVQLQLTPLETFQFARIVIQIRLHGDWSQPLCSTYSGESTYTVHCTPGKRDGFATTK